MKPRTIAQRHVYSLAQKLPGLSKEQTEWAKRYCLKHKAYRLKNGRTGCLDCGHVWHEDVELITILDLECPNCGIPIRIENTRRQKLDQRNFFAIIDVVDGYQLCRFFEISTFQKVGTVARIHFYEVVQLWMHPDKKLEIVARNRSANWYSDHFHGWLEIRDRREIGRKYDIFTKHIYPRVKVLPTYKRNGFKGNFHGLTPYLMFNGIVNDPVMETLLKARQYGLLNARVDKKWKTNEYWSAIKICIRNKYIVKDSGIWFDYLDLLRYFGKDVRNAKFVCPLNLKAEHDLLVARKTEIERRQNAEREARNAELARQRLIKDNQQYITEKGPYFGLCFSEENLVVTVLQSIEEFRIEADALKHCVFTNAYYRKNDSLILSAQIDGVRTETIEIILSKMKIEQSRGLHNNPTEHQDRIIGLVEKNLKYVRKVYNEVKKKKKEASAGLIDKAA